jgi:GH43 family beta-xylosidase
MSEANQNSEATYTNPVYAAACADPFILKYLNEYWCYCTGWWRDRLCFGVLHSRDLQNWREIGGALTPYDTTATCYWAPEVSYENGRFLMYYSVGNEDRMQIRVAEATHPAGPFTDCGVRLTSEEFAIDPHVFTDNDGARYLFYATDFLEHTHIGTGTVRDRMLDPLRLAGEPRPVTRARYDWQVYDPNRVTKGGVRWHTVEGPFVLEYKHRYYQMFSGGNWQNATYGASYAISDNVLSDNEWQQVADGQRVLPVLRTLPQLVLGPGHNSAVCGPDNQQMYCIYHAWYPQSEIPNERILAIDRLDWVGERLTVLGPTVTPQPKPQPATLVDFFDQDCDDGLGSNWSCDGGQWQCQANVAVQQMPTAAAEARCLLRAPYFTAEASLRFNQESDGAAGIKLFNENGAEIAFQLLTGAAQITEVGALGETSHVRATMSLSPDFVPTAFHLLRVEVNGSHVTFTLDNKAVQWTGKTHIQPQTLALFTRQTTAGFAGFALNVGWQDLFTEAPTSPAELGWYTSDENNSWRVQEDLLWYADMHAPPATILKHCPAEDYELVINAKLMSEAFSGNCYGFYPALDADGRGALVTIEQTTDGWALRCVEGEDAQYFALAADFDPYIFQQFRLRKEGHWLTLQHEADIIGTISTPPRVEKIGLYAHGVVAAFDLVRVTVKRPASDL